MNPRSSHTSKFNLKVERSTILFCDNATFAMLVDQKCWLHPVGFLMLMYCIHDTSSTHLGRLHETSHVAACSFSIPVSLLSISGRIVFFSQG